MALKADELYQSRVSPSAVNLLSDDFGESLQVNLVSSRARVPSRPGTPKIPNSVKIPPSKRSLTPAPTSRSPTPSGLCWFHKKQGSELEASLFLFGKRVVRQVDPPVQPAGPSVASAPEEFCSSTLLFMKDILSDCEFLVDSGASVSVFPGPYCLLPTESVCLLLTGLL